jgi:hypothetical protein
VSSNLTPTATDFPLPGRKRMHHRPTTVAITAIILLAAGSRSAFAGDGASIAADATLIPSLSVIRQLTARAGEAAYQKKNYIAAQELLLSAIRLSPEDGRLAYYLGTVLILDPERDPEKLRAGTFYYARAAHLMRTALGLDQYWAFVRVTPLAPEKVEEYPAPPPEPFDAQMAFQMLRDELLGPNGAVFFEDALRMNQTPRFKGRLIEHRPAQNPVELVLSVDTPGNKGDVRVFLTKPLPGSAPAGTVIEFEGLVRGWQPNPFVMSLQSEPKEIKGWPLPIPVESSRQ